MLRQLDFLTQAGFKVFLVNVPNVRGKFKFIFDLDLFAVGLNWV